MDVRMVSFGGFILVEEQCLAPLLIQRDLHRIAHGTAHLHHDVPHGFDDLPVRPYLVLVAEYVEDRSSERGYYPLVLRAAVDQTALPCEKLYDIPPECIGCRTPAISTL